jgi:hypothetical protein
VVAGIERRAPPASRRSSCTPSRSRGFNDDELDRIAAWAWQRGLVPRFIEQMPMAGGLATVPGALLPAAEIRAVSPPAGRRTRRRRRRRPRARRRTRALLPPRVRRRHTTAARPPRRFGIISPMTEHFCDTCNRLRLSTTGALHTCLAYDDAVDLREPLHSGWPEAVAHAIRAGADRKTGRAHLRRSSASAVRARRWYKSADEHRRAAAHEEPYRRPGARVRGALGRAVRARQRQHGSRRRAEMAACASLAATRCAQAGARVDSGRDTADSRSSSAASSRIRLPTVTVYNHLDVQPADGEGWRTPPFQLTRDASTPAGALVRAGATDDKGPALTALYGARLALEHGVRANIQFLWELEEEIGSPHFAAGLAGRVAGDAAAGRRRSRPIRSSSPTRSGSRPASRRSRTACAA